MLAPGFAADTHHPHFRPGEVTTDLLGGLGHMRHERRRADHAVRAVLEDGFDLPLGVARRNPESTSAPRRCAASVAPSPPTNHA